MKSIVEYINEGRKVTSLKKALRSEDAKGFKFYKIGHDLNGNPLWCVKKDDVDMDKKTANSLGFRSNKIKDENGQQIEVWTCQSYSISDTAKYMIDSGVESNV